MALFNFAHTAERRLTNPMPKEFDNIPVSLGNALQACAEAGVSAMDLAYGLVTPEQAECIRAALERLDNAHLD